MFYWIMTMMMMMIIIIMIIIIVISNGNRTLCRPIRSVIIRVINKIGRPRSGSPICLITSKLFGPFLTEI